MSHLSSMEQQETLREAARERGSPLSDERLMQNLFIPLFITFDKKRNARRQKS